MAIKYGIVFALLLLGYKAQARNPSPYIAGGTMAQWAHPYMVALTVGASNDQQYFCGGSIISQRTVLTAAHCIAAVVNDLGNLNRRLAGIVGTNRLDIGGVRIKFSSHAIHQHFNPSTFIHDLGLLYTKRRIMYTDFIKPILLGSFFVGGNVKANTCGWGRTGVNRAPSNELLELTNIFTVSGEECVTDNSLANIFESSESSLPINSDFQLCALHSHGAGNGTCQGDSGSPLVHTDSGAQIGIVSWGHPCARGFPDVFTRISAYEAWFVQHVII